MMKKEEKNLKQMYEYIKIPEVEDQFAFRISEGKFKDVVYKYNKFGVNPDPNPDDTLTYKFEYDIIEIPEEIVNKKYTDEEGKEFESLIGEILIDVIQENIEMEETEDGKTRRYDTKKSIV